MQPHWGMQGNTAVTASTLWDAEDCGVAASTLLHAHVGYSKMVAMVVIMMMVMSMGVNMMRIKMMVF